MRTTCFTLLLALASVSLTAQTFVVDVSNGPGTNFTSLATAVSTVPDGAVLEVRAGLYFEAVTIAAKSLTLLGDPGVGVYPGVANGFTIQNLSASQTVVVRGIGVALASSFAPTLLCRNNAGLVFLDSLFGAANTAALVAENCQALLVRNVWLTGSNTLPGGVRLTNCTAAFEQCLVFGMQVVGGSVQIADSDIVGLSGLSVPTAPAIRMNGGVLRMFGGSLTGGSAFGTVMGPVIDGSGTVRIDPATPIVGSPPFAAGIQVTTTTMPKTSTELVQGNTALRGSLTGPAGTLGILVLGLRSTPIALPGAVDPLWLDPNQSALLAVATLSPTIPVQATVQLPNTTSFRGHALVWQGLSASATALEVGNPAWITLP